MTHAAYFYLVGQATAYLFANWLLSLGVVFIIFIAELIAKNRHIIDTVYWVDSGNGLWGWLSVFYVSEFILMVPPVDFFQKAKNFNTAVNVTTQVLIFAGVLSIFLLIVTPEPYLYGVHIFVHAIGIFILSHMSFLVSRIPSRDQIVRFYFIWAVIVIVNDLVFMIFSSDNPDVLFWTCFVLSLCTVPFMFILAKHINFSED